MPRSDTKIEIEGGPTPKSEENDESEHQEKVDWNKIR